MSRIEELDIVIRHKDGRVTAGIPQLALYVTADDVHAAITALEQKRTAFFGDLAGILSLGMSTSVPYTGGWLQLRRTTPFAAVAQAVGSRSLKDGFCC